MKKMLVLLCGGSGILLLVIYGCQNMNTEMSKGQMLYSSKCSSCHQLIPRESHSEEQWRFYVERHGRNMTGQEKRRVLDYLGAEGDGIGGVNPAIRNSERSAPHK